MKKFLFLVALFVASFTANAQYSQIGANTLTGNAEQYITNSPTNTVGNRVNMLILKDSLGWENRWKGVRWTKYTASKNDGLPSGLLWTDATGFMKHSPMSEVRIAYSQLTGAPTLFSGDYNDLINRPTLFSGAYADLTGKPTLFSGSYADLTGKPTLFSGSYTDLTNKPSFATVATSGNYNDLINKPTIPTIAARVFNNNVARTLNSNYTISTTRDADVNYSVALSVTNPLLAGTSTASAFLEYSTDGGTNWITVSQVANASSVGLSVTIAITLPNTVILSGKIPANALVRIRTTVAGTATATYTRGQEVLE